jgi:hypothetical protein
VVTKLLIAWALMAACVAIHASGLAVALGKLRTWRSPSGTYWSVTWLYVRVAAWVVLLHLLEITVWGLFYTSANAFEDVPAALYFSAVTYTTTGYGDLLLPATWRIVGGVEALTGILMCGWSTGFFFAVTSRIQWYSSDRPPQAGMAAR